MPPRNWNQRYAEGNTPWDKDEPDVHLVALAGELPKGRVLDVGCGTASDAVWLAERGYDVVGVDLSPLAIERAEKRCAEAGARCALAVVDFLHDDLEKELGEAAFDLVFDRGVFHVFDEAGDRALFASRVADLLRPEGRWLSVIGSTEGPARDRGPPRRSARDIADAVEPALEIVELRGVPFAGDMSSEVRGWVLKARPRATPAVPSTGS